MSEQWTVRAEPEHLPPIPFSSGGLHQALVNPAGEVIATVWNHHGDELTLEVAQAIAQTPRMLAFVGVVANLTHDQTVMDEAAEILRACGREP